MHEDINSFRAGWFLLQDKQWEFHNPGWALCSPGLTVLLQVHRWKWLRGHPHDKNLILVDFTINSSFFTGEQKHFLMSVAAFGNGNLETEW